MSRCLAVALAAFAGANLTLAQDLDLPSRQELDETLQRVVEISAQNRQACVHLDLFSSPADAAGADGLANVFAPGAFALTVVPEFTKPGRDRLMAQLLLLKRLGFVTEEHTRHVDQTGTARDALTYRLTTKGWIEMGNRQCVPAGKQELLEVLSVRARKDPPPGFHIYDVEYKVGLKAEPEWMSWPEFRAWRGGSGNAVPASTQRTVLMRVNDRLISDAEFRRTTRAPSDRFGPAPRLTLEAATTAVQERARADSLDRACLLLPHGSKAALVGDLYNQFPLVPYYASYFDLPDLHHSMLKAWSAGLILMQALEKVGMTRAEPASPVINNGPAERGGARYVLKPEYEILMHPRRPGCLPFADLDLKVMSIDPHAAGGSSSASAYGIGAVRDVLPWVKRTAAAQTLAPIRAALEHGIGFTARVSYRPDQSKWVAADIKLIEFDYAEAENPAPLFAALPRSQEFRKALAASGVKQVHVVTVKGGALPGRQKQSAGDRAEAVIEVIVEEKDAPMALYLSSEEPVHWRMRLAPGVQLIEVIAVSSRNLRVTGLPRSIPLKIVLQQSPGSTPPETYPPPLFDPYDPKFRAQIESATGGKVVSLQHDHVGEKYYVPRRWPKEGR